MQQTKFEQIWNEQEKKNSNFSLSGILSLIDSKEEILLDLSHPTAKLDGLAFQVKSFPKHITSFEECALFIEMSSLPDPLFAHHLQTKDFHSLTCSCGENQE